MKSFRENPDGEENQLETRKNEREIFALQMMQQKQADDNPFTSKGKTILYKETPIFDYQVPWNEQQGHAIASCMNLAYVMGQRDGLI